MVSQSPATCSCLIQRDLTISLDCGLCSCLSGGFQRGLSIVLLALVFKSPGFVFAYILDEFNMFELFYVMLH